jgi:hypothetical protein
MVQGYHTVEDYHMVSAYLKVEAYQKVEAMVGLDPDLLYKVFFVTKMFQNL